MPTEILQVSILEKNGTQLNLNETPYTICESEGLGMAPFQRIIERGVSLHGERDMGYLLDPRTIRFHLQASAGSLEEHFLRRAELLSVLRPAADPLTLRITFPGGEVRDIDCHLLKGLDFYTKDRKGYVQETEVVLRAPDPTFYDPQVQSTEWIYSTGGSMELDIVYTAGWHAFPLLEITGPIENPALNNETTGELIRLDTAISLGETVTIDTRAGIKTVKNQAGTNLMSKVNPISDLGTFHLEANGSVNTLTITGSGMGAGITKVKVNWNDRYIGI